MPVSLSIRRFTDLAGEFKKRDERALKVAMEDTLFKQKEVVPVAFASAQSEYGWPLSYQAATAKPDKAIQGGTLKRSLTAFVDMAKKKIVWKAQQKYGYWVHQGTTRFLGRPYLTRPIRETGIPSLREALREEYSKPFKH